MADGAAEEEADGRCRRGGCEERRRCVADACVAVVCFFISAVHDEGVPLVSSRHVFHVACSAFGNGSCSGRPLHAHFRALSDFFSLSFSLSLSLFSQQYQ